MSLIFLFLLAFIFLFVGIPVAFAFGMAALLSVLFSPDLSIDLFGLLPFRIYGIMQNSTLIAVPLFIFMGLMLERSNIAQKLLESTGRLFGSSPGGLAISVVLVGAILAASTGVVGASVVMMSVVALPVMLKNRYNKSFSAGVVASSGTLGQIIPPSVVLIILGDVMQVSVGDLFKASMLPGVMLVLFYILYIVIYTRRYPHIAPPLVEKVANKKTLFYDVLSSAFPTVLLILMVLGGIFAGVVSPTESSAIGALGAMILTIFYRKFSLSLLKYAAIETVKYSAMIFTVLIGATAFTLVFNDLGGGDVLFDFFSGELGTLWAFMIVSMLVIFILGFFIDFIEISFIIVPLFVPIATHFGIDPIWYAILVAINLQTSFLTPPFGFALFYLKGAIGDKIAIEDIYKGVVPFIGLQLLLLFLVLLFPQLIIY